MVQGSSPAPSTGKSTTSKVIKDFILGGTSGAIAKTLAALSRELSFCSKLKKIILNSKTDLTKESLTVSKDASNSKV